MRANHLWNAAERQITLHAARNEFVAFQVLIRGSSPAATWTLRPELVFDGPAGSHDPGRVAAATTWCRRRLASSRSDRATGATLLDYQEMPLADRERCKSADSTSEP